MGINWKKYWLAAYAVGLTIIPPLHASGKTFYAAELLLFPLILVLIFDFFKKPTAPPKMLILVWAAATAAFVSGMFRGDLAAQITQYPLSSSLFDYHSDGITYIRWLVILATPWMAKKVFKESSHLDFFMSILQPAILASGLLAIADRFKIISLENLGYFVSTPLNWVGRSYGTFATPNEAGLMYGFCAVYLITASKKLFSPLSLATLVVSVVALALTHCGTAIAAVVIAVFAHAALTEGRGWKVYSILGGLIFIGYLYTQRYEQVLLSQKIGNLLIRQVTWRHFAIVAPEHPLIIFFGIGFSKLVVDNSLILLLVQGGFFFLITVVKWIKELTSKIPQTLKFVFFFWGISWLTLDSITYWGIGRLCWILLGLLSASTAAQQIQKDQ